MASTQQALAFHDPETSSTVESEVMLEAAMSKHQISIVETPTVISLTELENRQAHERYLGLENASLTSVRSFDFNTASEMSDSSSAFSGITDVTEDSDAKTDYSQLDRFGFIIVPPKESRGHVGRTLPREDDEESRKREEEKRGKREAKRAIKWVDMLKVLETHNNPQEWPRGHRKFESRLVKGVPDCLRTKIWPIFLSVSQPVTNSQQYRELYLKISGYERQIDLDIERTLRDHILFKARFGVAQISLFKILVAYSNLDPEVGYCQGMSTVGAFLLLYFEEELAFNMICALLKRENTRSLFTAGFPLLFETFYVQEQLMRKYMPELLGKLNSCHITTSVYATKWYLTLFLGFPFSLATRIWDLMLFWGMDMLICVALALLKMHENRLLLLEYESCMQFLSKLPDTPIDEQALIKMTWKVWKRVNPHYHSRHESERNPFQDLRQHYRKITAQPKPFSN